MRYSDLKIFRFDFVSLYCLIYKIAQDMNVGNTVFSQLMSLDFAINISWDVVKHAESYTIYRSNSSSNGFTKVAEGITGTFWQDDTPLPGNNYYQIYAVGHGLTSQASSPSNLVKYEIAAPTNVVAALNDKDFVINVTWDAVKYAESYIVYRSNSSSNGFVKVAEGVSGTYWQDNSPLPGNNYYRIYATSHNITSPASNTSLVVKYEMAAPQNVMAAIDNDDFSINVSWDVVKHAESYTIYRSKSSSNGFMKVAEGISGTYWQDDAPLPGNNYYQIYAMGHGLTSQASSPSNLVKYEIAAPTNVVAALDDKDFVINVTWDAVKYAESYIVYRSNSSSNGFVKVAEGVSGTYWQDNSPLPGNNYYWIYATSHNITSPASNTSKVVKYEMAAPTNVVATLNYKDFVINVTWDVVKYAESYIVYRNGSQVAKDITSTNWRDDSPLQGGNYYVIIAVSHGIMSSFSSPSETIRYELSSPQNVMAALDDKDFVISVSWNAVKHAEYYSVYRSKESNTDFTKVADNLTTTTWYDLEPLPGNNYYQIYAMGHGIASRASSSTDAVKCEIAAPANVIATLDNTNFFVDVTWDAVKYAESYIVYRNGSQVAKDITSTNWRDNSPRKDENYYVIYAVGHGMTSEGSTSNIIRISDPVNHPPVEIVYNGSSANLHIPSSIAKDVTAHVSGAHVTINNNNTTEEIEFVLSGTSTNGSLTYNGSYKCKFILNGLTLTSKTGAAIDIESGKRSDLILMEGTTNTLEDAALGTQKACLYCDGHLEISGGGSLIVAGNAKHAIATNEYMQLKKTTGAITITKAASDAIHAEQYFQMNGGVLNISGMVGDGIQAEAKVNKVVENNGEVIIKGGSITIAVTSNDTKGIKSDTDIHISGGTFNIAASGAGSKGISCNGNMFINEDDNTTAMTITASGRIYTDANDNDSRCMGIKVDGNLTISAGTITVYNTGSGSRGIKVDGTYTKSGTAKVNASVKN